MSERNGSTPSGTGTAEIPVVRPAGATASAAPGPARRRRPPRPSAAEAIPAGDRSRACTPTAPVTVRPRPRMPRRGPLTVMGPWAPVAGGLLGLVLGVVAVLFLAGTADDVRGPPRPGLPRPRAGHARTSGVLLADEVRMMRQRAREAAVRPALVEATAGLLNGLTPARLLLAASAFVLFLAAYVSR